MYKRLIHLRSHPTQHKYKCIGFFGHKIDLLNHYEKQLEAIEQNVRMGQSEVTMAGKVCAFTSFSVFHKSLCTLFYPLNYTHIRVITSIYFYMVHL